ncbi:MAG: DUF3570 domain-containing protein [Methyloglobulus sp.]
MAVIKKPDYASLHALTAAALILPGLLHSPVHAAEDDEVDFQYSHYQEGQRAIFGMVDFVGKNLRVKSKLPNATNPIEVDSIRGGAKIALSDRVKFAFNYTQDTWSGATPIATAPAVFAANRPFFDYRPGKTLVGASPLVQSLGGPIDGQGNPLVFDKTDPVTGLPLFKKDTQLTHTMAYASPETRKEGDFKLSYQWDEAQVDIGGGISVENDYESRFGNLGGRWDFNQKQTSVNLGLSYTNSDTNAILDPGAFSFMRNEDPGLSKITDYPLDDQLRVDPVSKVATLRGNRQDWGVQIGLTQALNKDALIETGLGYTRSTGFMENPYKATTLILPRSEVVPNVFLSSISTFIEQRPDERNQLNWNLRYAQYIAPLDAAAHLGYSFHGDDWGTNAHTFEADWVQPLGNGWVISPRVRYYSQDAADFYHPYLVIRDPTGGLTKNSFPASFSSDQRLSGYGSLSGGVTVSKQFAKGVSLETGFEYYSHAGALKLGGGGEGDYADFNYYVANAALKVNLSALGQSIGNSGNKSEHNDHAHHRNTAPAGVLFSHMLDKADSFMVGYRYMRNQDAGNMLHGTEAVGKEDLLANGCAGYPCQLKALDMTMNMHMLDLMYAPTDWLNLMLMPQFVDMEMHMGFIGEPPKNHGHGGGHSTLHNHASGGVGDTGMYALVKIFANADQHLHLGIGFSAPTGDVGVTQTASNNHSTGSSLYKNGLMHYGMQLGSGTWDFKPSLTYTGQHNDWSWGAQLNGTKRLEGKNKSGYALGDIFQSSVWGGYGLTHWLSATVRGVYTWQGAVHGSFAKDSYDPNYCSTRSNFEVPEVFGEEPSPAYFDQAAFDACPALIPSINTPRDAAVHSATVDQPSNYGGHYWDVGFGLNVNIPDGAFAGNSLSFEWLQPVYTNVNGYQLNRDGALAVNWNYAF